MISKKNIGLLLGPIVFFIVKIFYNPIELVKDFKLLTQKHVCFNPRITSLVHVKILQHILRKLL